MTVTPRTKRLPGRPAIGPKVFAALDPQVVTALDRKAAEQGITRAALIRDVLMAYAEQNMPEGWKP